MTRLLCYLLICVLTLTACPMNASSSTVPSRNMSLKAFDPHRQGFECKHEADHVPPIDLEAEAWLHEGLRVTSRDLWPNQRDYPKAVALWTKAAERKHWKAMMNLAGVLIEGDGTAPYVVAPDPERAVKIVEDAMQLGIPAAFDAMGSYHQRGLGVKGDISRAYAFWELAADMGNPNAQTFIGRALMAAYDNPKAGIWSNHAIGLKMVECAFAQGYGKAAYELGLEYRVIKEDYVRAILALHEGVKMGSEDSSNALSSIFRVADESKNAPAADTARSERYSVLGDALYRNPDLKFPNLDKVLPLPPTSLPKWDGNKQTLIDAAKAVLPVPPPPVKSESSPEATQRTGRARIPDGHVLPEQPALRVPAQYESTAAPEPGYWIARLMRVTTHTQQAWNAAQLPIHYAKGELFDRSRPGLQPADGRIQFHYVGQPVALSLPDPVTEHPRVAQGIARRVEIREPHQRCRGNAKCPQSGIWSASVNHEHPMAAVFNQWHRQSYVMQGQSFPDPRTQHLDIAPRDVTWLWLGNANELRFGGIAYVSIG